MKTVIIVAAELKQALKTVAPAVNSRTIMPILQNVLIEVKKNKIIFTTNNHELIIQHSIVQENEESFTFCAPFDIIQNIALSSTEEIKIEVGKKNMLHIQSGINKFNIASDDCKEFPIFPPSIDSVELVLPDKLLLSIANSFNTIGTTKLGAGTEHVLLDMTIDGITVVSSDRFVLFSETFSCSDNKPHQLLLSSSIVKCIKDKNAIQQIVYTDKNIFCVFENTTYVSVISEATYGNYKALIPQGTSNIHFKLQSADLAIKSISIISAEGSYPIVIATINTDSIVVNMQNIDLNYESASKFEIENKGCPVEKMAFKASHFISALKHFSNVGIKNVTAFISDALKPIVLTADDSNIVVIVCVYDNEN